jgi:hypothetical protein
MDSHKSVKIYPPHGTHFARCEPQFCSYRVANLLKRKGLAVVVGERPLTLRIHREAVANLFFTAWNSRSKDGTASFSTSGSSLKVGRLRPERA